MKNLAANLETLFIIAVFVSAIMVLKYGHDTQCPDTAIYVYCGK